MLPTSSIDRPPSPPPQWTLGKGPVGFSFPGINSTGLFALPAASHLERAGARWGRSMCSNARFVERSLPIRKTVLGAPPFMDRRLAPFANEPAVDSTGERNMIGSCRFWRNQNAADGSPGVVSTAESGAMGEVEGGPVTERYWTSPWQACGFCIWGAAGKGWNSSVRPETTVAVFDSSGSGGNISRTNCRLIASQDCSAAWPIPSTISRAVDRNQGRYKYRATMADERAWQADHAPWEDIYHARTDARSNSWCSVDYRAPRRNRGPRDTRALGRGPAQEVTTHTLQPWWSAILDMCSWSG